MASAAAAASVRSLLHSITALPSRSPNHPPLLPTSSINLPRTKPLHLETSIRTLSPSLHRRLLYSSSSSAAAAAYTETDDDYKEEEEEEEEEGGGEEKQSPKSSPGSSSPEEAGRLYVGNLPYTMTSSQLTEIFSQAGTVDSVEIVYDRVTNRSRGFAFVTMASTYDANEAIRMFDGSQVGGRTVKVNFPEVPRGGEREVLGPRTRSNSRGYVDSPYKVYAGNLGWTVTSESLKDAFAAQPGLLGAKVIYEQGSRRSRGFGFVSFVSPEDTQSAIDAVNGKEVAGRPLRLSLASERSSGAAPSQASGIEAEAASSSLKSSLP